MSLFSLCNMFVIRSVFYLGLMYCQNLAYFPYIQFGIHLDLHLGESTFSLVLSHPMDQSFSSILQTQVELGCKLPCLYFFFNWAAKVMLNMLFNTYLKIKQGNTEIRLEEKRGNKVGPSWQDIRRDLPIQDVLTWV